jgi:hypothetical protein
MIGAIGQAVSALALVVVIVQLRMSAVESLRSIRTSRWDDLRQGRMQQAQSEWLNGVVVKAMRAYGAQSPYEVELVRRGLTEEEACAFNAWMHSWWFSDTQNIELIDKLTNAERATFDAIIRGQFRSGFRSHYLEMNRDILNPDTVRYIENLMAQPSSTVS